MASSLTVTLYSKVAAGTLAHLAYISSKKKEEAREGQKGVFFLDNSAPFWRAFLKLHPAPYVKGDWEM